MVTCFKQCIKSLSRKYEYWNWQDQYEHTEIHGWYLLNILKLVKNCQQNKCSIAEKWKIQ